MKIKFECATDEIKPTITTVEFDTENIDEIRENFILFLRGVGFHVDTIKESVGDLS